MIEIANHQVLTTLQEKVSPQCAAVLVIDMQRDFTYPGGFCDRLGIDVSPMADLADRLAGFLDDARRVGVPIVHVHAVYDPKYMTGSMHERLHRHKVDPYCQSKTDGVKPHPGLEPRNGEAVVVKHRFDAFYDTELDIILRCAGVRSIIATGVATHACVDSTCRHGYFKGYYVVFPWDLTGGANAEQLTATIQTIDQCFGVSTTANDIRAAWEQITRKTLEAAT